MRLNYVKEKLRKGRPSFGTWLAMDNLHSARLLARSGLDWLTLDVEHSAIDWARAATLFGAIADAGCVPLCRVPEGDHYCIKRALDAGAWGIVVPMVDTVEQAKTAIAAAKYPPEGNRSVGGGMHSLNFDAGASEYQLKANDEILVVLMTESPTGVENAEAIYALDACDAIFVGPTDLRFNMRAADGTFPSPEEHDAMIQRVIAAGRKTGTPTGIHALSPDDALRRAEQGMQFIAVGSDLWMINHMAGEVVRAVCPDVGDKDLAKY